MFNNKGLGLSVFLAATLSFNAFAQDPLLNLLGSQRSSVNLSADASVKTLLESSFFVEGVTLNLDVLGKDAPAFNFNLGNDSFAVSQTHSYDMGSGYHSWNGTVEIPRGAKNSELLTDTVNFVVSGNRVFGQIRMVDKVFEISTLQNGQHIMAERDFSKIGYGDDTPKGILPSPINRNSQIDTRESNMTLNVMQIASNAAIDAAGGVGPIVDRMNFFISQSNQAYSATSIPITMASAGLFRATNNERTTAQQNASGLRNLNDGFNDSLANGTRNSRGADLVAMIVATPNDPSICGIVNAIGGGASNGFFVVKFSCTDFTFVHEAGHLFGARHQNDNTTTPFSFGHGIADFTGNFRSIMGTTSTGLPRLGGFSNPDFTVGGRPFGTTGFSDNDRVHRERASTVAGFR